MKRISQHVRDSYQFHLTDQAFAVSTYYLKFQLSYFFYNFRHGILDEWLHIIT